MVVIDIVDSPKRDYKQNSVVPETITTIKNDSMRINPNGNTNPSISEIRSKLFDKGSNPKFRDSASDW